MNERIQELAEQAWKEILDETNIDGDINTMFSADEVVAFETKFAELIIKECAIIANRADNTETEIRCMYDIITEHFGVE
jgi:hypothetical protein